MKSYSYIDTEDGEKRITACFNYNEQTKHLSVGLAFRREGDNHFRMRARAISSGRSITSPHFFADDIDQDEMIKLKKAFRGRCETTDSNLLLKRNLKNTSLPIDLMLAQ